MPGWSPETCLLSAGGFNALKGLLSTAEEFDAAAAITQATNSAAAFGAGGPETTTLYGAISAAERADIESFGGFRAGPNSYEGKLFATSAEDATRFGQINHSLTPGGEPFFIVEVQVPSSMASGFESFTADGMTAIHVSESQLGPMSSASSWSIWDWLPWIGK